MKTKLLKKLISIQAIILLVFSFTLTHLPTPVFAASCNWTGGSGDWETDTNWSCGAAPTSADDAIIDANVTVTINAAATINSLTLGNAGGTTSPT